MRLYNSRVSGNCYKVRLLLHQLDIPFETVELDVIDRSNRREVLGDKNPALRVPVLEFDGGATLAESNAILWYLADGTAYLPDGKLARAHVLQWLFFEQYDHEPNIAVARFWIKYSKQADEAKLAPKLEGGYRALDAIERHFVDRPFLVDERYTIADIALYAYTHVAGEGGF